MTENQEHYQQQVENLWARLEGQRHTGKRVVFENNEPRARMTYLAKIMGAGCVAGAVCALGMGTATGQLNGGFGLIQGAAAGLLLCTPLAAVLIGEEPLFARVMAVEGNALAMNYNQRKRLLTWVEDHPRLLGVLGKWGADNTDHQINQSDYQAIKKFIAGLESVPFQPPSWHNPMRADTELDPLIEGAIRRERLARQVNTDTDRADSQVSDSSRKPRM